MNTRVEAGMAIDATVPFEYEQDFQRPVYPIQRVSLEKFFSAGDIGKGKSLMQGWAEVLARSGR
jgi:hypothetical protein